MAAVLETTREALNNASGWNVAATITPLVAVRRSPLAVNWTAKKATKYSLSSAQTPVSAARAALGRLVGWSGMAQEKTPALQATYKLAATPHVSAVQSKKMGTELEQTTAVSPNTRLATPTGLYS